MSAADCVSVFRRVFLVFLLTGVLAACGGGGGGDGGGGDNNPPPPPPPPPLNKRPVADAGVDLAIREGESAALDGSRSADADGTLKSFHWIVKDAPAAALEGSDTASPTFTAPDVDEDTTYVVELVVTDDKGATAGDSMSVLVFRHIEGNQPPEPVIAPLAGVEPGASAVLDGSGSLDADGAVVAYEWRQLAGPAVELTGADTALASFQAPAAGTETPLLFRLLVTDDRGERSALDLAVTVGATSGDLPPVADAGPDQIVNAGDGVQLSGADSQDPEASALTYAWTQTGGNDTFEAVLDDPASATPSFTAPADIDAELVLAFEITVADPAGQQSKDSVAVTVRPQVDGNQLPVAVASGPLSNADGGEKRGLRGFQSSDPDGSITAYQWTQVAGPDARLEDADQETAQFTAPFVAEETVITFRLTVTDDVGAVAHDDFDVIVNPGKPVTAVATANGAEFATVVEGAGVVLDGRGSVSLSGTPLTFTWAGDAELAVDPVDPAIARFTAPAVDEDTELDFDLTVSDGTSSDTAGVSVLVKANRPPVVNAGLDLTVNAGDTITLDGGADDPEGGALVIQWQQLEEDGVPQVALENADTRAPTFMAPAEITEAITLQFRMTATDDENQSAEDVVAVTVHPAVAGNQPPVAVAGDQAVDESAFVTLDGSASHDPDGDNANLAFEWIQIEIPEGQQPVVLSDASVAAPTFIAPAAAADLTLKFRLVVTDEQDAVSAPVIV
ncbi:MAG TPA: PKD domain-containing protein, partial [Gammaproteobacteria bacterium]